jgi:hypothetical protein
LGRVCGANNHDAIQVRRYTSNEGGVGHALLEDEPKVDEADALFMLGTCAAFVSYVVNKAKLAGLLK